ncbi:MAG: hypothetical protein COW15_12830 [Shewanella sp. CG12_big_fil_rev_8_21_14_0_65_47_15]|nr:MAG: hypothetical protein COW15_12830 [Shewanella sp. CG12_big_fil_rev_8_21_14_0_65_47_15]
MKQRTLSLVLCLLASSLAMFTQAANAKTISQHPSRRVKKYLGHGIFTRRQHVIAKKRARKH